MNHRVYNQMASSSMALFARLCIIFFVALFTGLADAQTSNISSGDGGIFIMENGDNRSELKVFFLAYEKTKVVFEVHMKSLVDNLMAGIDMSQQFHLKLVGGTFQIEKGFMKIPQIDKPQIVPPQALAGLGRLQTKDFLIGSQKDISGQKVGEETLTEGGLVYKTTHYKKSDGGQSLEYWISDQAKPIGLVRLKSTGQKSGENYSLSYRGPLKNMKSRIDTSKAEPLSSAAEMFLPLLSSGDLLK